MTTEVRPLMRVSAVPCLLHLPRFVTPLLVRSVQCCMSSCSTGRNAISTPEKSVGAEYHVIEGPIGKRLGYTVPMPSANLLSASRGPLVLCVVMQVSYAAQGVRRKRAAIAACASARRVHTSALVFRQRSSANFFTYSMDTNHRIRKGDAITSERHEGRDPVFAVPNLFVIA